MEGEQCSRGEVVVRTPSVQGEAVLRIPSVVQEEEGHIPFV